MSQAINDLVIRAQELERQGLSTTQIAYVLNLTENRVEKLLDLEGDLSFPERRPVESPRTPPKSPAAAKSDGENVPSRRRHGAAFGEIVMLPRVKGSSEGRTPAKKTDSNKRPVGLRKDREPAKCGTPSGYNKHLKSGEEPCRPCRDAKNEVKRKSDQKKKENIAAIRKEIEKLRKEFPQHPNSRPGNNNNPTGNNGKTPAEHGTLSGYARHIKDKSEVCPECREACISDSARRKSEQDEKDMREVVSLRREIEAIQKVLEASHKPYTTNSGRVICNVDTDAWPCKMMRDVKEVREKAAKSRKETEFEFNTNPVVVGTWVDPDMDDDPDQG